jgi:sugar O-acyltransferase (sialic acid O-acetyltransferase NeuD family)
MLQTTVRRRDVTMNLILVGSGGFAEEFLLWTENTPIEGKLKGYLGSPNKQMPLSHLGEIDNYEARQGEQFILAIGDPEFRLKSVESLKKKGAAFQTFVHPSALVSKSAKLGEGVLIGPFCFVSVHCELGEFTFLNVYASIGHHSTIGKFTVMSPYASVTGNCEIGEFVQIATHGLVIPKTKVGNNARIAPGAAAYRTVPENALLTGVPGKVIKDL